MEKLVLKNLNIELLYDPTIPLLVIYPTELKTYAQAVFIAELFIRTKIWKQSKCPSADECLNKVWHIHAMGCYSSIKRNKVLTHGTEWMNLENIMPHKKAKNKMPHKICRTGKFTEKENKWLVARKWGEGGWGMTGNGDGISF